MKDNRRAAELLQAATEADMHEDFDEDEELFHETIANTPKIIWELDTIPELSEKSDQELEQNTIKIAKVFLKYPTP